MNPAPAPVRNHSLDALRATALLLGVLLHAALAYLPGASIGWAVQDRNTHVLFSGLVLVIHSFRLGIFFLLAGYFGRLLHHRLGGTRFIQNRMTRIFVPFVAGWMLVFPFLAFGWIWGAMHGDPLLASKALALGFAHALQQALSLVGIGARQPGFPLTHLWFLYYLLLVYGIFLGARALARGLPCLGDQWNVRIDASIRFLLLHPGGLPVLILLTWGPLLGMRHDGIDTPDKTFVPHVPALALYGFFFVLGWMLHRQEQLLEGIRHRWGGLTALALVSMIPAFLLAGHDDRTTQPLWHAGNQLACASMMWSWILACLGLFLRFCSWDNAVWRYLADSSYWVYIIHLPMVVALQVALSRTTLPCGVKFAVAAGLGTLGSLVSYHLLVRSTPLGLLLNGRRHPFRPRRN